MTARTPGSKEYAEWVEGHLALSIQESVRPTGGCRITKEVAEQLEGRKALRRVQRSQQGIELIRGHRVIRRCTSCQRFTREQSGQDGAGRQEGTECPGRGVSGDYESA